MDDNKLRLYVDEIFLYYDKDNSGTLDPKELTNFFNEIFKKMNDSNYVNENDVLKAIKNLDEDFNGVANKEEIFKVLKKMLGVNQQESYSRQETGYSSGLQRSETPEVATGPTSANLGTYEEKGKDLSGNSSAWQRDRVDQYEDMIGSNYKNAYKYKKNQFAYEYDDDSEDEKSKERQKKASLNMDLPEKQPSYQTQGGNTTSKQSYPQPAYGYASSQGYNQDYSPLNSQTSGYDVSKNAYNPPSSSAPNQSQSYSPLDSLEANQAQIPYNRPSSSSGYKQAENQQPYGQPLRQTHGYRRTGSVDQVQPEYNQPSHQGYNQWNYNQLVPQPQTYGQSPTQPLYTRPSQPSLPQRQSSTEPRGYNQNQNEGQAYNNQWNSSQSRGQYYDQPQGHNQPPYNPPVSQPLNQVSSPNPNQGQGYQMTQSSPPYPPAQGAYRMTQSQPPRRKFSKSGSIEVSVPPANSTSAATTPTLISNQPSTYTPNQASTNTYPPNQPSTYTPNQASTNTYPPNQPSTYTPSQASTNTYPPNYNVPVPPSNYSQQYMAQSSQPQVLAGSPYSPRPGQYMGTPGSPVSLPTAQYPSIQKKISFGYSSPKN